MHRCEPEQQQVGQYNDSEMGFGGDPAETP